MQDLTAYIEAQWESGNTPNLVQATNDFADEGLDYVEVAAAALAADCSARIRLGKPQPDWHFLSTSSWQADVSFEILYARLQDSSLRHALRLKESTDTSPLSIEDYLPKRIDPHAAYYSWFLEYLIYSDKTTRFELDPDSPLPKPDDYDSLYPGDDSQFLNTVICSVTNTERDYNAVCGLLDKDTGNPAYPFCVGEWIVKEKIGTGANGVVYLAANQVGLKCALKIPIWKDGGLARDNIDVLSSKIRDFLREARNLYHFNEHPGILKVFQVSCPPIFRGDSAEKTMARLRHHLMAKPLAISMEHAPGGSLRNKMSKGQLHLVESLRIIKQLCQTLKPMHGLGFAHRDINPNNVLFDDDGEVVLADFGLANHYTDIGRFRTGEGTPLYRSPEQVNSKNGDVNQKADVWAIGVLLHELVTGSHPFRPQEDSVKKLNENILEVSPPDVGSYGNNNASENLSHAITACLAKDPKQRADISSILAAVTAELKAIDAGDTPQLYYAWNPYIYSSAEGRMRSFIYLIEAKYFAEDLYTTIEDALRINGCRTYRIYQVFGSQDLVVRAIVPSDTSIELAAVLDELKEVETSRPVEITNVIHHWHWGITPTPPIDLDRIKSINEALDTPQWQDSEIIQQAREEGYLRFVRPNRGKVHFFVFFRNQSAKAKNAESAKHITKTARTASHKYLGDEGKTAVYDTSDNSYLGILKGEADDVYSVGELVSYLNAQFKVFNCISMTCVVSDPAIRGGESLKDSDLRKIDSVDFVYMHFVRVGRVAKDEAVVPPDDLLQWLLSLLSDLGGIPQGETKKIVEEIDLCLAAALTDDMDFMKTRFILQLTNFDRYVYTQTQAGSNTGSGDSASASTGALSGQDLVSGQALEAVRRFTRQFEPKTPEQLVDLVKSLAVFLQDFARRRATSPDVAGLELSVDNGDAASEDTTVHWENSND